MKIKIYCERIAGNLIYKAVFPAMKNLRTEEIETFSVESSKPRDVIEGVIQKLKKYGRKEAELVYMGPIKKEYLEENEKIQDGKISVP